MDEKKIRYATAHFSKRGEVVGEIEWHTGTCEAALLQTRNGGDDRCAMFHYKDIRHLFPDTVTFFAEEVNATREQFEADPDRYGVCYYLQPFEGGRWTFE